MPNYIPSTTDTPKTVKTLQESLESEKALSSDVSIYNFAREEFSSEKKASRSLSEHTFDSLQAKTNDIEKNLTQDPDCEFALAVLSSKFGKHISPIDVLSIFFACLKLMVTSREQEKLSRRQEREFQIAQKHIEIENFKTQGNWLLFSGISSGVLGVVSGALPIVGHMGGDTILNKLQGVFSSLKGADKDQFFKGLSKMTYSMSEMNKSTGQIQQTFSEGDKTRAQHLSELARSDSEECTRSLDEMLQEWRGIENFLTHYLQMEHDTAASIYR